MAKCWRVCKVGADGAYQSVYAEGRYCRQYHIGRRTRPRRGTYLFAFAGKKDAMNFMGPSDVLLECVGSSFSRPISWALDVQNWEEARILEWWQAGGPVSGTGDPLLSTLPTSAGTIGVKWLIPVCVVWARKGGISCRRKEPMKRNGA